MSTGLSRAPLAPLKTFNGKLRSPGCQTCFIPAQINFDTQNKASHVRADLLSWCAIKADNLTPDLGRGQLASATDKRSRYSRSAAQIEKGARLIATYLPALVCSCKLLVTAASSRLLAPGNRHPV